LQAHTDNLAHIRWTPGCLGWPNSVPPREREMDEERLREPAKGEAPVGGALAGVSLSGAVQQTLSAKRSRFGSPTRAEDDDVVELDHDSFYFCVNVIFRNSTSDPSDCNAIRP